MVYHTQKEQSNPNSKETVTTTCHVTLLIKWPDIQKNPIILIGLKSLHVTVCYIMTMSVSPLHGTIPDETNYMIVLKGRKYNELV